MEDNEQDVKWIYEPLDYTTMSMPELHLFLDAYKRAESYEECALIAKELEHRKASASTDTQ